MRGYASVACRALRILCSLALASLALALPAARAAEGPLVVLELFTSQSCYSCPPAEELLASEYLDREDVLALEVHVDYWDELVYGSAGKWKDIWSKREHTERQYLYNERIRGRRSAYTPQTVIGGAYETSGTNQGGIDRAIREIRSNPALRKHSIRVAREGNGSQKAKVSGPDLEGRVFGIVYETSSVTEIKGGENNSKILRNHNIVKRIEPLQPDGDGIYSMIPVNPETEGCAFIVQDPPLGVIRAAARCVPAN